MVNKNRALYIFKYLWGHTDEEHVLLSYPLLLVILCRWLLLLISSKALRADQRIKNPSKLKTGLEG